MGKGILLKELMMSMIYCINMCNLGLSLIWPPINKFLVAHAELSYKWIKVLLYAFGILVLEHIPLLNRLSAVQSQGLKCSKCKEHSQQYSAHLTLLTELRNLIEKPPFE